MDPYWCHQHDSDECAQFVDRCTSIDSYRQQQEFEDRTQQIKEGGNCDVTCYNPRLVVVAEPVDNGLGWVDKIHLGLNGLSIGMDATGVGGGFSWIPDALDGIVSAFEGDWKGAGMSIASAVPFAGIAANTAKMARIGEKAAEATKAARTLSRKLNRTNVNDPDLVDAMDNLWRKEDLRPGGTIGELLRESQAGGPLVHLQKAKDRMAQLINRVNDFSRPLSQSDRAAAERVINDLKDAIRQAEGR